MGNLTVKESENRTSADGAAQTEGDLRRMVDEALHQMGRETGDVADVVEPPGADYCVISFSNPDLKPIEIPKPLGAGESQEQDEIRRALAYRLGG